MPKVAQRFEDIIAECLQEERAIELSTDLKYSQLVLSEEWAELLKTWEERLDEWQRQNIKSSRHERFGHRNIRDGKLQWM